MVNAIAYYKGVDLFEARGLNFRLKRYVLRQYLWTVRSGNGHTITLPLEVFTRRQYVADFIRLKLTFILKKEKSFFDSPLGVTYAPHLQLVRKPVVDFPFVIIELFSLSLTVEMLGDKRKSVEVDVFRRG